MTLEDAKLERLLRSTIGAELDSQRGRALAAFRAKNQNPQTPTRKEIRWLQWYAASASALAACLAIVLTAQFILPRQPVPTATGDNSIATAPPAVDQVTLTRNVDGGTVVLDDGSPARLVREQTLRKTQWFDPQENATYSVTEPLEKVGYERLHPY